MAVTNHERVGKALTLVRDAVRPEVERSWRSRFGPRWLERVNRQLHRRDRHANPDDLAFLLRGMDATWDQFFRDTLSRSTRSYLHLLWDARNRWAHNERFSSEETLRILDHCEMMLEAFRAGESAGQVQELKQSLRRQVFAEERRTAERRAAAGATKGEPLAGLKPWREVVIPHRDVREGRFAQAEFAANLRQVVRGEAAPEYGDPEGFFERTFITEGLGDLIRTAARRLSGEGGDPVVELQTGFGGGKTHSLIALYHLASGTGTERLRGVDEALADDDLTVPGGIRRAVFTGQWAESAVVHTKEEGVEVHTMWGEIAYQLGGAEGYRMVEEADRTATNPGESLVTLFRRYGPVMILIDEWVAYARNLPMRDEGRRVPAGDFDTQFTFAQTLTEAAAAVDDTLLVVSVPESGDPEDDSMEVGGEKGRTALERLRHVLGRSASQWRPASSEESFEIVRRRLFEPIEPAMARHRDAVVRAYHKLYADGAGEFPSETREQDYARRMEAAYPIHPELFDRLYQDWSTLERFQRTRGVLRLMASVISVLWDDMDRSLMIMPGVMPMASSKVVPELTRYLADRWKPIIDADVDGPASLPYRFDRDRKNLGRYSACRRVARTTYVGSAPLPADRRGIDRTRIVLGCVQPGERAGVFVDALRHLAEDATYLYNRQMRYWYDTKPSLTRIAADRALSMFDDYYADDHLRDRIEKIGRARPLGAVHVFPESPEEVLDEDDSVRLVIIRPSDPYERGGGSAAEEAAGAILDERRGGKRINRNMVVFLAAEKLRVTELRQSVRSRLAWKSILDDRGEHDLNLTPSDVNQAQTRLDDADETVDLQIKETFSRVLYPVQAPGESDIHWTSVRVTTDAGLIERVAHRLESSEHLVSRYSGIRVRSDLDRREAPLWKGDHIGVRDLWSYYCRFLYMPRLAGFGVLAAAISQGVASLAWQNDTFAYAEEYDPEADRYPGLTTGAHVEVTQSLTAVLVRSTRAQVQLDAESPTADTGDALPSGIEEGGRTSTVRGGGAGQVDAAPRPTRFYGRMELDPVRAIRDLGDVINEVANHLRDADSKITYTLEIEARSEGYDTRTRRVVGENATQLGFEFHEFEH